MVSLVGYTGFVGSNILAQSENNIDNVYNSKNIEDAYGTKPDMLIYAGMKAEKYLANTNPEADKELVFQAEENMERIAPKKIILISTIDVFHCPNGLDEDAKIQTDGLDAYGLNRYELEQWVREYGPQALVIRLPGLYGKNIKKNFIYDYINIVPFRIKEELFGELAKKDSGLHKFYILKDSGFYQCKNLSDEEKKILKNTFKKIGFSALNFTDSRSVFQFYPLCRLWNDIQTALKNDLRLCHMATAPISAGELYKYLTQNEFINEINLNPAFYNYKTKFSEIFGGADGYLMNKGQVLEDIKLFMGEF